MKTTPRRRLVLISLAVVTVLIAGAFVGRAVAWPAYKRSRVAALNADALAFLDASDPANALLVARKSLRSTTQNPEAWRIAAIAAAQRERADAVWYQDNLCREQPTVENRLELLRLALRFNAPGLALDAVDALAGPAAELPEFHRLAAQIRLRTGRPDEARRHLAALARLAPGDHDARLELARLELAADPGRADPALRARVLALADQPLLATRALALLLRENTAARRVEGTAELVRRLRLTPEPDPATRLLLLDGLLLIGDPDAAAELARMQSAFAAEPANVAPLLALLSRHGRGSEVAPWVATLPAATRDAEAVQRETAEALLALEDHSSLVALLRGARWTEREYLRSALLAHAHRALGEQADFTSAWRLALLAAGSDEKRLTDLLGRADAWRWAVERHEVVWRLFGLFQGNVSIQDTLVRWERHRGNTPALHRLFARIVEVSPDDEVARNNFAYTGLLLDVGSPAAARLAAGLAETYPNNPYYATTLALALHKRGDSAAALARLDALTLSELSEPVRALLRALCLASLGQAGPAADLLDGLPLGELLPEERALAVAARTELARLGRDDGNRGRLLALSVTGPAAAAGPAWLDEVDAATRGAATTDMNLAASLQRGGDWAGLRDHLRAGRWGSNEYLRSSLLALALLRTERAGESREAWLQALALADRDGPRLENLRALAVRWGWEAERFETLARLFNRTPSDRVLFTELLAHHRAARRTPQMLHVLDLHLGGSVTPGETAVAHAYYSLLLDVGVARAEVMARSAHEAAPADATRRRVRAFSLWRQNRAPEAIALLDGMPDDAPGVGPTALLRAAVLLQLGDVEAARASLARFRREDALPEEIALADQLAREFPAPITAVAP